MKKFEYPEINLINFSTFQNIAAGGVVDDNQGGAQSGGSVDD